MRRYVFVAIVWTSLAALLTVGLGFFTHANRRSLEREATLRQRERARELATQLDTRLVVSEQIASSLAALAPAARDRETTEDLLRRVLASTSSEFVYGVGIWYEPWRFDPAIRFFGPYAHRAPEAAAVVTYEWSTDAYDYPTHGWYRLGHASTARPAYTEPYFDVDYVYMTTTRAFFDARGAVLGVVSVDLILPQLRDIVAHANVSPGEVFWVTTRTGALLAHPAETRLLDFARSEGKSPKSLLDLHDDDVRAFDASAASGDTKPRSEQTVPIGRAGWTMHVATDADQLFAASASFARSATFATLLLWGLLAVSAVAYTRWLRARDLAREIAACWEVERALEDNVRARDDFLAVAAHELKSPITPLCMRLQLLVRQTRAGKPLDVGALEKAAHAAERLAGLVGDLLDAARVHAGRLALTKAPMSLVGSVRDTVASVAPMSPRHRVVLDVGDDEIWIRGDRQRLEQVVTNLVVNAIKYSPHGGVVTVAVRRVDADAVVSITDEGIGIPAADQAHLFERYFRSPNAPATSFGGLGLGLYICREIVELHGGRMWFRSEEGKGSTFSFALPAAVERESGAVEASRRPAADVAFAIGVGQATSRSRPT